MKKDRYDLELQLDFSRCDRLNSNLETVSAIEKAYSNSTAKRKDYYNVSEKEIIVGLGFIISLLLFNGWQLYSSFSVSSVERTSKPKKVFIKKTATSKIESEQNQQKIELLAIQNIIYCSSF